MRVTVSQDIIHDAKAADPVKEFIDAVDAMAQGGQVRLGASRQVAVFSLRRRRRRHQCECSDNQEYTHD